MLRDDYGQWVPEVAQEMDLVNTYIRWLSKEPMQDGVYTWRTSFNYTTQMFTALNNYMEVNGRDREGKEGRRWRGGEGRKGKGRGGEG